MYSKKKKSFNIICVTKKNFDTQAFLFQINKDNRYNLCKQPVEKIYIYLFIMNFNHLRLLFLQNFFLLYDFLT